METEPKGSFPSGKQTRRLLDGYPYLRRGVSYLETANDVPPRYYDSQVRKAQTMFSLRILEVLACQAFHYQVKDFTHTPRLPGMDPEVKISDLLFSPLSPTLLLVKWLELNPYWQPLDHFAEVITGDE